MNTEYRDGSNELLRGLSDERLAQEMKGRLNDPNVESVQAWREDKDQAGPYPNNRAGRRKWAAMQKRADKRGKP